MLKLTALLLLSVSLLGCSSFSNSLERFSINVGNGSAHIQCYSGGTEIIDTTSVGKVTDDSESDGFFFQDKDGTFKEVNADCIFTYDK